jgi:hypothetical protein
MHGQRRVIVIAKERPFDPDKWQQLLIAFAYALHEQRKQRQSAVTAAPPPKVQP